MNDGVAAFLGAVVGGVFGWVAQFVAHQYSSKKRAEYLAIRVVCELDEFVDMCAHVAMDSGEPFGPQDEPSTVTVAPAVPTFPDDLDWRSIDTKLAFAVLSFSNRLNAAERTIINVYYEYGPESGIGERQRQYAELGKAAFDLSRIFRNTYSLGPRTFEGWSSEQAIEETLDKLNDARRKMQERFRKAEEE